MVSSKRILLEFSYIQSDLVANQCWRQWTAKQVSLPIQASHLSRTKSSAVLSSQIAISANFERCL